MFTARVKSFVDIAAVTVDFAAGTKVHRMASAVFAQEDSPTLIKIGRIEIGDADLTAALTAIEAEDPAWYALAIEDVDDANITLAVAFIEARAKIFGYTTEEEDIITVGGGDIGSVFKAATRNRSFGMWNHHAGRPDGGSATTAAAADGTVTVTDTAHPFEVGDPIVVLTAANAEITLNSELTIATVPDANTFTFVDPGVTSLDAGPDAITYFVGFTYPNCAWMGLQLATNPGSSTWKHKRLSGIDPSNLADLSASEELIALGKNVKVYPLLGATGVGMTTEGVMASGRFIDVQRSIDFMEARMGEAIVTLLLSVPKIPYTDAGMAVLEATINQQMNSYIGLDILAPLLNRTDGKLFLIVIPKIADQLPADRTARLVSGIQVQGQLAGAVHKIIMTINAQV